jgi:tRNA(fMet)-specific endonuclease VapC
MGLIVDSCILIASERGRFDWQGFSRAYADQEACLSAVSVSELLQGVHRADSPARRVTRLKFIRGKIQLLPIQAFGYPEAEIHAELVTRLASNGLQIGAYDAIIAATAMANNWSVATLNLSEFNRIEGLKIIDVTPWLVK